MTQYKYVLQENEMPTHWYNILADMKNPPPPYLHPGDAGGDGYRDDLPPVFPDGI